jgi:hypothetical protein
MKAIYSIAIIAPLFFISFKQKETFPKEVSNLEKHQQYL